MTKRPQRSSDAGRFAVMLAVLTGCFILIGLRLVYIQVFAAPGLSQRAEDQHMRDIELPARRGTIYDREGEPLAVSVEARTVFATPNTIKDKPAAADALASTLGGDREAYLAKLERGGTWTYIDRQVDLERAKALEELDIDGIGFIDDYRRTYPSGELACQVLGFVGVDDKGLAGLESQYDETLGGKSGLLLGERDPYGRPIPGGVQKEIERVDGHDIVLTIDKDIQYHAQLELAKAVKQWGAKSGSIVVMDTQSGEVYAMASVPGFDPNKYGEAKAESIRNMSVTDAYEPGSTIKSLTAASVIDAGLAEPETKFNLPPTLKIGGRTIHESHGRGAVTWTLTDIVTNSSNVGSVKLGQKLGEKGLYEYFSRFGLTEKTGVDFPGEAKGWLPPVSQWSASSIANIPFGQGVSVTPLQLSRAIGALGNGGTLVTPHLLLEVPQAPDTKLVWPTRSAVPSSTASAITEVLQAVVSEGTGKAAAVPGYTVAGKTGTAQKALPNGGGYAKGRYIASFIGYLPAEDPRIVVCVTVDEPRNAIYGGTVAAPTFSKVAAFTVSHLKIPPSSAYQSRAREASAGAASKDVGPVSDDGARD